MIVIYRNGQRTVVTGWRAGLLALAAAVFLVVIACLALGFALTLMTLFIFGLPIAIVLALIMHLWPARSR
jgi:hypothetical protein